MCYGKVQGVIIIIIIIIRILWFGDTNSQELSPILRARGASYGIRERYTYNAYKACVQSALTYGTET